MPAHLHFNQSSPIRLPLPLMLAAPLFGLLAMLLVIAGAPDIFASRWNPALIAAVHLFTLGFLGCTMFAAVLQILPVITGRPPLRNRPVMGAMQVSLISGVLLFACGMFGMHSLALRIAVISLAIAISCLVYAAAPQFGLLTRFKPPEKSAWRGSRPGILLALLALIIAAAIGLRLLAGWGFESISLPRQLTDLHAGWATIGWVAPLIFAVSLEVVPMFQFTRALPVVSAWLPAALFAGALLTTFSVTRSLGLVWLGAWLVTGAVIILERQWRRPHGIPNATFHLFRIAMLSLIGSVLIFSLPTSLFETPDTQRVLFMILFLSGFAGSCVMGMLLKIVPFLVRLHLQRELWVAGVSARTLPAFNKMISPWMERALWPAQGMGLAVLTAGLAFDWQSLARTGFATLSFAMLLCATAVWQAALKGRKVRSGIHAQASNEGVA